MGEGLAGHHGPFPLARSLLQGLVTVIWHLQTQCTAVL